jgi:hypothetical protein
MISTDRKHTLAAHDPERSERARRRAIARPLDIYDGRADEVGIVDEVGGDTDPRAALAAACLAVGGSNG